MQLLYPPQVCPASGFDISTPFQDPDYFDPNCPGGRDWFTNGVWTNNATLVMAQVGNARQQLPQHTQRATFMYGTVSLHTAREDTSP